MSYSRPILIEIYTELQFEPGTFAFAQVLEAVPRLHRSGFSIVESGELLQLNLDITDEPQLSTGRTQRIRCWSDDRTKLVQLAADSIAANLVSVEGTYPGWPTFLSTVFRPAWESIRPAKPRVASLALNTIDRFSMPSGAPLGEFLLCGGPRIPSVLADTTQAFDYDIGRGFLQTDSRNRQLHINGRPTTEDGYVVSLRSVFHERVEESDDIFVRLERLHDDSNESFESLVTDRTRSEVMKGVIHARSRV